VDFNRITNEIKILNLITQSKKRIIRTKNGYKRLIKTVRLQFVKVYRIKYKNIKLIKTRLSCF
jgi:hypothetical protein